MKNSKNKIRILFIALFVSMVSSTNLFSQKYLRDIPVLDSTTISRAVSYFEIKDNAFEGNGAAVLKEAVTSSKFLLLGENHYSKQISILTKNLVPLLDESGYKVASFEVGPHSANKLKELSSNPVQTLESLKAFNKEYFIPSIEMSAIPMFFYVDDAKWIFGELIRSFFSQWYFLEMKWWLQSPMMLTMKRLKLHGQKLGQA